MDVEGREAYDGKFEGSLKQESLTKAIWWHVEVKVMKWMFKGGGLGFRRF